MPAMSSDVDDLLRLLAAELRAEMGRQNRSRRWLAERLGHSHVTVSRWLTDGRMPLGALAEICAALNIDPVRLLAQVRQQAAPTTHPRRRADDTPKAA